MKPGAVIVDLAVEQGGNVEGSELDKIVVKNGVKIVGIANLPALVATDASALYARNVLNFLALSLNAKTGEFAVPKDDEIIQATLVCENGAGRAEKLRPPHTTPDQRECARREP